MLLINAQNIPHLAVVHTIHLFTGVAVYYSDVVYGAPPALEAQVTRFPALHEVNVIITIRNVPVPQVLDNERLLMKPLPIAGFYHVIAR